MFQFIRGTYISKQLKSTIKWIFPIWFKERKYIRMEIYYHYCTTSFNKAWTQVLRRFKSCSRRVGDSRWWGSLTMVSAGNKTKRLSSVNHTTKIIHHHHRHHHPSAHSTRHGINSLLFRCSLLWNNLSRETTDSLSTEEFKEKLKEHGDRPCSCAVCKYFRHDMC